MQENAASMLKFKKDSSLSIMKVFNKASIKVIYKGGQLHEVGSNETHCKSPCHVAFVDGHCNLWLYSFYKTCIFCTFSMTKTGHRSSPAIRVPLFFSQHMLLIYLVAK